MLVIGNYLSPYVRKVLVVLGLKGIEYKIDPIVPFFGDDEFSRLSPLRRIPVLIDGDTVVNDSTIICEYLEEQYPDKPLRPDDPVLRARARWIEEYCDSRMGDVVIWRLFYQRVIGPGVFNRPTDEEIVRLVCEEELPRIMDWFEEQAPTDGFLFGDRPSVGDITPACFFRNAAFAGWIPDPAQWPRTVAWVNCMQSERTFTQLAPFEKISLKTSVADQRARLLAAGAPIAEVTVSDSRPRKSLMGIGGE